MPNPIFLIGAPRSATTCISKIFEMHPQCAAYTEVEPKLRVLSREYYEGKFTNGVETLKNVRQNLIDQANLHGKVFVDKNPCYLPFTKDLIDAFDAKIVFLVRDGRDVIRSMRDCVLENSFLFGLAEDQDLNCKLDSKSLCHNEKWDYSRIRPLPYEECYNRWPKMDLLERCSWYWSKFNSIILNLSKNLPKDRYTILKTDRSNAADINLLFRNLDLSKMDDQTLNNLINARVNSIEDKFKRQEKIPYWENWPKNEQEVFNHHAFEIMKELGYY